MITEKTEWCIRCDECPFEAIVDDPAAYLYGPSADGRWYDSPVRLVCRGCIIDRACRIFGHQIVRQPDVLGGRTACTRCQTFQAVAS